MEVPSWRSWPFEPCRNLLEIRRQRTVVVEEGRARADALVDAARAGAERVAHRGRAKIDSLRRDDGLDRDQLNEPLAHRVELGHAVGRHRRMILDAFGDRQEVETCRVSKVTNVGGERGQRFLRGGEARLLWAMARELSWQIRSRIGRE